MNKKKQYVHCLFLFLCAVGNNAFSMQKSSSYPTKATFDSKGNVIAIAFSDNTLQIWDPLHNKLLPIPLDSIKENLVNKKIHALHYSKTNQNHVEITICEQPIILPTLMTLMTLDESKIGQKIIFDMVTQQPVSSSNETIIRNQITHNGITVNNATLMSTVILPTKKIRGSTKNQFRQHFLFYDGSNLFSMALHKTEEQKNLQIAVGFANKTEVRTIKKAPKQAPQYISHTYDDIIASIDHPKTSCTALAFCPDGKFLFVGKANGLMEIYGIAAPKIEETFIPLFIINSKKDNPIHDSTSKLKRLKQTQKQRKKLKEKIAKIQQLYQNNELLEKFVPTQEINNFTPKSSMTIIENSQVPQANQSTGLYNLITQVFWHPIGTLTVAAFIVLCYKQLTNKN